MTTDNTVQMLKDALAIIENEERWTTGALFEGVDLKNDPLCNNTKVCALGALALAAWGPEAVKWETLGGYRGASSLFLDEDYIQKDERTCRATRCLNEATEEVTDGRLADIASLNDLGVGFGDRNRALRYELLKDAFRLAIQKAENA